MIKYIIISLAFFLFALCKLHALHLAHKPEMPCAFISPLHTRSAGFGVQLPTTDIPSGDAQVALILPAGTKRSLHLKNITAPLTVVMLWMFSIEPFLGAAGTLQLTGGRKV